MERIKNKNAIFKNEIAVLTPIAYSFDGLRTKSESDTNSKRNPNSDHADLKFILCEEYIGTNTSPLANVNVRSISPVII